MEQIEPNVGGVMLSKRERERERERGNPENTPKSTTNYHNVVLVDM